ncbi:retropepsin-like aspartic protease family protein [Aureimonas sp. AU40]|uniref:retropepsin-like aspartic protease family protein n=1 Tax=Aureimonas sp. AU40 TaxID=1637747 RepID=UPI0007857D00|nr:TIGR02281 family clan AA aspartic protease [Aureimonas sp. AU40]
MRFLAILVALFAGIVLHWAYGAGEPVIAGLDSDRTASLLYLGLWSMLLGSSVFVLFRHRWGEAFRALVIWGFAFLVLIGAYAYRDEFAAVRNRVMAELWPGYTVSAGTGGEVMAVRADDRHFHVDASVNGRPVSFLVDTGASVVAIDPAVARRIGIDTDRLAYTSRIQTANGVARAAEVTLESVRIGSIERRNVRAVVSEGSTIGSSLLGMSFLGTLGSFEFRGDRLILRD